MTKRYTIAALAACSALVAGTVSAQDTARFEKPVRIEADGAFIDTGSDIGYAGPMVVDHDGDGLQDLLVSAFRGNIRFFKNVGTREAPEFEEKEPLQAGGEILKIKNW